MRVRAESFVVLERCVEIGSVRQMLTGREHTDNRVRNSTDLDRPSEHRRVTAERTLPEPVIEDRKAAASRLMFFAREPSTKRQP